MSTDQKMPTVKECLLLYLARLVRQQGGSEVDRTLDIFGRERYVITPWRIETKVSVWAQQRYCKYFYGSTVRRRWRELREEPQEKLERIGFIVKSRPPTNDEPVNANKVWVLVVNRDTFDDAIQEYPPFINYSF